MSKTYTNPRMNPGVIAADPVSGTVRIDFTKTLWTISMFVGGTIGAAVTFSWSAVALFVTFTLFTLCFGHSLGMHRLFIHRSYRCSKYLEYVLVHLGTLVGMAGPFGMLRTHDLRDWAQRQPACHNYFSHDEVWYRDFFWQLFCTIDLRNPPGILIEDAVAGDRVLIWMERYWQWQQAPWALLFLFTGGWSWVFWGICARVSTCLVGHWLIGYFAHNAGHRDWHVAGAAVQGHNVPWCALLTMGECWHNNHHAFPGSARLGIEPGQWDPGWTVLRYMRAIGLVDNVVLESSLPARPELSRCEKPTYAQARH